MEARRGRLSRSRPRGDLDDLVLPGAAAGRGKGGDRTRKFTYCQLQKRVSLKYHISIHTIIPEQTKIPLFLPFFHLRR